MRLYCWLGAFYIALVTGCSSPPSKEAPAQSRKAAAKAVDQRWKFPQRDQVAVQLVDDKLLGKDFMPGGNLADYETKGKRYQLFLVRTGSANEALALLLALRKNFTDSKFVAHMGGYFGMDAGRPVYAFQKGPYLAGVVGLPEPEADLQARDFAARLN
ncbi:MAG: hypothetical protein IT158_20590 [Bryobacterales bacterium]|nr:hypothetical protein [Bryobacterales bacterium]